MRMQSRWERRVTGGHTEGKAWREIRNRDLELKVPPSAPKDGRKVPGERQCEVSCDAQHGCSYTYLSQLYRGRCLQLKSRT